MSDLAGKYRELRGILRNLDTIAVALSGGVDSTLLLHTAISTLGTSRVLACHIRTALQSRRTAADLAEVLSRDFPASLEVHFLELAPLTWPEFMVNDSSRCYVCKLRMYGALLDFARGHGFTVLADGTNDDDLHQFRPGLRAIAELGVVTPLAQVGLGKSEIRQLARSLGLGNHDQPANSCLATRVATGLAICRDELARVEAAEEALWALGFWGCRVRRHPGYYLIEIREGDFASLIDPALRQLIDERLAQILPLPAMLSLAGRK
mgnify:CR=1 FL=1